MTSFLYNIINTRSILISEPLVTKSKIVAAASLAILVCMIGFLLFLPNANPIYAIDGVTEQTLDDLNPLRIARDPATGMAYSDTFQPDQLENITLGSMINRIIQFLFPFALLILFVMLIWAGFEMFSGASNKSSYESARKRATMAVLGFILMFISYWLIQVIEVLFGIQIVS